MGFIISSMRRKIKWYENAEYSLNGHGEHSYCHSYWFGFHIGRLRGAIDMLHLAQGCIRTIFGVTKQ